MNHFASLLCLACFLTAGCKRTASTSTLSTPPHHAGPIAKIEACGLITKEEVGALQGTTISDTKSSETSDGTHLITQCYYAATGPNLSVSVAVTQIDPKSPNAPNPRAYWERTFGQYDNAKEPEAKKDEARGGGREEEEKSQPPKKVDGLGEDAFWVGDRFGGALYVLKGDAFIRISVGGPDNEQTKLEKSKTFAQKALSRL
jgi:hypothetical protein